ncbi:MAG: hypothetical protein Tsb005_09410 [Gammaproteobacteria bacterium]
MKKIFTMIAAATVLIMGVSYTALSYAADQKNVSASNLKIAVIDFREIVREAPEGKAIANKLKADFKPRQEKIVAKNKEIEAKIKKLKRDAAVMSADDREKLQGQILAERRDLQRMQEDMQQDLSLERERAMEKFLDHIEKAVKKVAKNEHYDLILQKNTVPYSASQLDVTKQVLKELS